jgi:hypothetical protein
MGGSVFASPGSESLFCEGRRALGGRRDPFVNSFYGSFMEVRRALKLALCLVLLTPGASGALGDKGRAPSDVTCYERLPFWQRVTDRGAEDYCRLVDRARARLFSAPKEAAELSEAAQKVRSPAVAARLLHAHAELLLGRAQEAHREFTQVVPDLAAPEVAAYLTPSAVAAGARAALRSGAFASALARYRWVLLRLNDFQDPHEEARLLIEAATAVTYAHKDGGREARAYLSTADTKNAPLLRPLIQAARALSLLREGERERAQREASQFESSWAVVWMFEGENPVGAPGETIPVLPPGEQFALFAAVADSVEPEATEEHFRQFLEEAGPELPEHLKRMASK